MAQGTVKEFDEAARTGSLLLDDGTEIEIDTTSIEGTEIRMLRLGQRVRLEVAEEAGRRIARGLHIVTFV